MTIRSLKKNDQIGVVTHGEGLCFRWSATPSIPRRRGPSGCQFCGFSSTYAYMIRPRTTKFGVGGHPHHCILQKCVARFVSDSWLWNRSSFSRLRHSLLWCFCCPHGCTFQWWKIPPLSHADDKVFIFHYFLHCALAAAQCIVIGPVCLLVAGWVAGWVDGCVCLASLRLITLTGEKVSKYRVVWQLITITGCATAQHCYNDDVSFLWEKWKF